MPSERRATSCSRPGSPWRHRIRPTWPDRRPRTDHLAADLTVRQARGPMDLTDTEAEAAFRAECRTWLEANVPDQPLPSGDTRPGFALHLEWEKRLFADRWSVVSWPAAYGGRDATLWEWLIFEEEYYRAGAPQRVTQNGIFLLAPTIFEFGTQAQRDAAAAPHGRGRGPVVPGLVASPTPAATWPASRAGPSATRPPAAGGSPGRRPGPPGAPSAPTCSACSAPTRRPSATGDSRTSWCPSTPRG